ncbi:DUF3884 family protein [Enterococcus faecalis]|uniref:DUF3884 family protein n=1 Tax=Enterococcus faecalis TaxID=1351 RepID=UPI003087A1BB|nr:DUF3884 family protein [Enterococcus faecalis]
MLSDTLEKVQHLFRPNFEKVYIVSFEDCPMIPELEATPLLKFGKWYVSTGKEWICHSDLELSAFEWEFLQSLDVEIRETIHFEVNYLPFQ